MGFGSAAWSGQIVKKTQGLTDLFDLWLDRPVVVLDLRNLALKCKGSIIGVTKTWTHPSSNEAYMYIQVIDILGTLLAGRRRGVRAIHPQEAEDRWLY